MVGILNRAGLSYGLKLSRYYKLSSNIGHYLPWTSTSLIKPLQSRREMCKYVKPLTDTALRLRTLDGIPLNYDIIYTSFEYHTITQYASATVPTVSVLGIIIQSLIDIEVIFSDPWTSAQYLWILTMFLYLNIGTAVISYKSPVRIYYDKKTDHYKAVFNGLTPFTKKRVLEFKKGMVKQIPPPDFLTYFRYNRYEIKGQKLYMFETFFRYPADLYNMFDEVDNEYTEE